MKAAIFALILTPGLLLAGSSDHAIKHIDKAATVLQEMMSATDSAIPEEILEHAQCVGVIPDLKKAGFVFGGKYGKGILVCRTDQGAWSAPSNVIMEGGSFGFQIGGGESDVVFVVQNKSGERKLMQDKFTIGGSASAMAGPVGRSAEAETDAQMNAEILSYSRSRGAFVAVSLEGATLRPDKSANRALYGRGVDQREILTGQVGAPASAQALYNELNQYAPAAGAR